MSETVEVPSGTWIELVKVHFPSLSVDECDAMLWEATAFPFGGVEGVSRQLANMACKANDLSQALYLAYGEMDACWDEVKRLEVLESA